jgi:hypothetical protein
VDGQKLRIFLQQEISEVVSDFLVFGEIDKAPGFAA